MLLLGISVVVSPAIVAVIRSGPFTPGPNPSASRSYAVRDELPCALFPESGKPKCSPRNGDAMASRRRW
jgi:hypothetical protein